MNTTIRTVILLLFVATVFPVKGQFALEQSYDHSLAVTRLTETEYAYYLMDVASSQCRIYTIDYVLWKTIPISLPTDYYLYDIKFVTKNLFNADTNVELWFSAYKWVATSATDGYYQYISKVINESGTVLATINNGVYAYVINTGTNQYKFMVYAYDNSFFPGSIKTHLFTLPGTATAAVQPRVALRDPYPNPANEGITVPLSPQSEQDQLQVFTIDGRLKVEQRVGSKTSIWLDTSMWEPGVYTYRVQTPGVVSPVKKFIVH